MTNDGGHLSILMNVHIPHYSMSGVEYMVGYKTCRHQAGSLPSSPLQNRKLYFNKWLLIALINIHTVIDLSLKFEPLGSSKKFCTC